MAQYHCLLVRNLDDPKRKAWVFTFGDKDRIYVTEEMRDYKRTDKRNNDNNEYCIKRAKSAHMRDVNEAVRRANTGETEWKDGRGGDQKTGKVKPGNREGIRYG